MAVNTERIVVYTCIAGDYDELHSPQTVEPGVDYVCFSDRPTSKHGIWKTQAMPCRTGSNASDNRFVKMHPHRLFPDHDVSIYVDGNIKVIGDIVLLIHTALARRDIALYEHPFRDCIYAEAEECAAIGHDWYWRIAKQMRRYRKAGFPAHSGLFEGNVIIRRHHSLSVRSLMDAWWTIYSQGVRRDQLSLPYLSWKLATPIVNLGKSDHRFSKKHFSMTIGHTRKISILTRIRGRLNRMASSVFKKFSPNGMQKK